MATAVALQAWVAWRDQRLEQAHVLAIEALELLGGKPLSLAPSVACSLTARRRAPG
ncbi:MAG TPA: hypothetical protein VME46_14165 [Acidimicrobiales bacterium]|nr:hypothetical protein [Acidimicrobiales bacterium]